MECVRPSSLAEFRGQEQAVGVLKILLASAKARGAAMGHVLLHGGPGLGKSTLARIVASELQGRLIETVGASLKSPADMAGLLSGIKANDVVFLDEIHAVPRPVEEVLYSAMEDFALCVEDQGFGRMMKGLGVSAKGGSGRTAKALPQFALLGATTILGSVTAPLRSRFAAVIPLVPYSVEQAKGIAQRAAGKIGLEMPDDVAAMVAARCKGTARIAVSLVTWLRDYATATGSRLDSSLAEQAFALKGVDADGLTASDLAYLKRLSASEGPVGLETLAAVLGESVETVESGIEPHLVGQGLVERTGRGRVATEKARGLYGRREALA